MGRPKGSKSKPLLDPENILPRRRQNDENENPIDGSLAAKPKIKKVMKTRKKSQNIQAYTNLVGPAIEFFPKSKLPQNKVLLQRYMGLRAESRKQSNLPNFLNGQTNFFLLLARFSQHFSLNFIDTKRINLANFK